MATREPAERTAGRAVRLDKGGAPTVAPGRAAQELALKRDEFQLAVQLGMVRTVPGSEPGTADGPLGDPTRGRVARSEIERLRGAPDFPDGLRERVRSVGTAEGARLLAVTHDRFARLARTGHFSPVRFYVNRYRAVVWLYPAADLGEFALTHPGLLTGRLPLDVRTRADGREDWRPRNWRARRLGMLLRSSGDPWVRAAAIASLLDPIHVAEVIDDPFERAYLDRFRPTPPSWRPNAPAAREIADRLLVADDPDEILWHRMSLALALDEARADRQAPMPGAAPVVSFGATTAALPPTSAHAVRPRAAFLVGDGAGAARGSAPDPRPGSADAGPVSGRPGDAGPTVPGPARPPGVPRPPGRRTRRSLLDRLRGRKEAGSRPGV
ncbi:DUF6397 family protein [Streptomyces sp. NPDC051921]|uniref:DUF6397 family protein n=1 Tax=Streptomyces sp. NPDC051921 TaxID=3155806 RepID=UPI0034211DE3